MFPVSSLVIDTTAERIRKIREFAATHSNPISGFVGDNLEDLRNPHGRGYDASSIATRFALGAATCKSNVLNVARSA